MNIDNFNLNKLIHYNFIIFDYSINNIYYFYFVLFNISSPFILQLIINIIYKNYKYLYIDIIITLFFPLIYYLNYIYINSSDFKILYNNFLVFLHKYKDIKIKSFIAFILLILFLIIYIITSIISIFYFKYDNLTYHNIFTFKHFTFIIYIIITYFYLYNLIICSSLLFVISLCTQYIQLLTILEDIKNKNTIFLNTILKINHNYMSTYKTYSDIINNLNPIFSTNIFFFILYFYINILKIVNNINYKYIFFFQNIFFLIIIYIYIYIVNSLNNIIKNIKNIVFSNDFIRKINSDAYFHSSVNTSSASSGVSNSTSNTINIDSVINKNHILIECVIFFNFLNKEWEQFELMGFKVFGFDFFKKIITIIIFISTVNSFHNILSFFVNI